MTTERSLDDLKAGESAEIVAVLEPGALGERLMEMGLTPGTRVRLVRRGLFQKVLQLRLRNYMLSIRRAQARNVSVREVSRPSDHESVGP